MVLYKIYKLNFVLILLCFLLCVPTFAQEYVAWKVNNSDHSSLEFAISLDDSFKGVEFDLTKDVSLKSIKSNPYLMLLNKYLRLARRNMLQKIIPLFSRKDGSFEELIKEVKDNPNKYSRFKIVERVVVDEIVKWGDYVAVNIRLYGKDGLLTPYTELFHCVRSSCKVSNRLYRLDGDFSFFAATMVLVPHSSKVNFQKKNFSSFIHKNSKSDLPIYLRVSPKVLHVPSIVRGTNRAADISSDLTSVPKSLDVVESFIRGLWEKEKDILVSYSSNNLNKKEKYSKSIKAISRVYKRFWNEDQNKNLISNYELIKSKESKESSVQLHESINYTGYSFAQLLLSWSSYHPFAFLVVEDTVFIWVEYKKNDNSAGKLLFSYDKKIKKLVLPTDSDVGRLLVNSLVAHKLDEILKQK